LFPGPKYDLVHQFRARLGGLSAHFSGLVLTATPEPVRMRLGAFRLIATPFADENRFLSMLSTARYFATAIAIAWECRWKNVPVDLVVTYDPLKTGFLGWIVAKITRSKFATEVNGDYMSWANYADVRIPVFRWLKRQLYILTETFVLKRADGIKLLYPSQIDYLRPILSPKVIHTFPDYVNLALFQNLGEEKVILFAGFPFFVKGVDILITAFKRLAAKYPDWTLKVLGWFPDPTELHACINGHPQIFHHEPVYHRDMPRHIGRCAILALPSRTEAMGRVLLEAMAAGKPRVGANVGGIPTVIEHGVDGFLFPPEDVDQLVGFLDRLMGDPALRHSLGRAGQARVAREFSLDRYFRNTTDFYNEILKHRSSN
jgi:glycosyltransferase involved in cell wall biosynthesis